METNVTASKAGMKYGLYGGLALVLYSLVMYVTGIVEPTDPDPPKLWRYLPILILLVFIVLGIKYFKDNNEGFLSVGEGIVTAIVAALIMAVFGIIWSAIYFYIIDPEGMETLRQNVLEQTQEQNDLTDEQMESMSGMINMMTSIPAIAIISLIMNALIGLVVGLIASLIMKNTRD